MNPFIVLIVLLVLANLSWAQTAADFIRDVQENVASTSQLMKVVLKHDPYHDDHCWISVDNAGFMGHKNFFECYLYGAKGDTLYGHIYLRATYKGEHLGYVRITRNSDTLFRYVDSTYTGRILNDYNITHNTDLNWRDLYEDNCNRFVTLGDLVVAGYYKRENGKGIDSVLFFSEMRSFWPLIRDRNHAEIVRNCKSINPTRKAYGALCLYILQQRGELLSDEEKQLLKTIRQSKETVYHVNGCKHNPLVKIRDLLTEKALRDMYVSMYRRAASE